MRHVALYSIQQYILFRNPYQGGYYEDYIVIHEFYNIYS